MSIEIQTIELNSSCHFEAVQDMLVFLQEAKDELTSLFEAQCESTHARILAHALRITGAVYKNWTRTPDKLGADNLVEDPVFFPVAHINFDDAVVRRTMERYRITKFQRFCLGLRSSSNLCTYDELQTIIDCGLNKQNTPADQVPADAKDGEPQTKNSQTSSTSITAHLFSGPSNSFGKRLRSAGTRFRGWMASRILTNPQALDLTHYHSQKAEHDYSYGQAIQSYMARRAKIEQISDWMGMMRDLNHGIHQCQDLIEDLRGIGEGMQDEVLVPKTTNMYRLLTHRGRAKDFLSMAREFTAFRNYNSLTNHKSASPTITAGLHRSQQREPLHNKGRFSKDLVKYLTRVQGRRAPEVA